MQCVYDACGVCCCCTPLFDRYVEKRDGATAAEWWALPAVVDGPGALPAPLRGVFWLDGNGDPSLLTFQGAKWDAGARSVRFPIYGVDSWASTTKLSPSACLRSTYVVTADDDAASSARIRVTSHYCCLRLLCAPCALGHDSLADFRMERRDESDPDAWVRESWVLRPCYGDRFFKRYDFLRVLDEHGAPTRHYARMAASEDVRALYTRRPFPPYCGGDLQYAARHGAEATGKVAPESEAIDR